MAEPFDISNLNFHNYHLIFVENHKMCFMWFGQGKKEEWKSTTKNQSV